MKKVLFIILISCFSLTIISCSDDKEEYSATTTDTTVYTSCQSGSSAMPHINDDGTKVSYYKVEKGIFFSEYKNNAWQACVKVSSNYSDVKYNDINSDGTKIVFLCGSPECSQTQGVYFVEYKNGTWLEPVQISDNATSNTVSISGDGDKITHRGSSGKIYITEYSSGSWQSSQYLNFTGNDPKISKDGKTVVAKGCSAVCASKYLSGSWQSKVSIDSNGGSVAVNKDGTKFVFFRNNTTVRFSAYSSGSWSTSSLAGTINCCDAYPEINDDGTKISVMKQFIEYSGGSWLNPVSIATKGSRSDINSDGTKIVIGQYETEIAYTEYIRSSWTTPILISNK